jgi:hypothetical protein
MLMFEINPKPSYVTMVNVEAQANIVESNQAQVTKKDKSNMLNK